MTDTSAFAPALSIVVPVYNGASTVGELVHALRALDIAGGLEIVLVVDGSPDNSLDVCKKLAAEPGAPVTVLSLSRNYGEHNAVMAGLTRELAAFVSSLRFADIPGEALGIVGGLLGMGPSNSGKEKESGKNGSGRNKNILGF